MHAQMILFLDDDANFALQSPSIIDNMISVKITSQADHILRESVLKHMVHCPCSTDVKDR